MKNTLYILAALLLATSIGQAQDLWPDYGGSSSCFTCHAGMKDEFMKSGHPWKVQKIDVSKVDANGYYKPFPAGTNETGVVLAPEVVAAGFSMADPTKIGFMIGGYGWKTRWMDKDGYIYKGTKAQYNLGTIHPDKRGHGAYDAAQVGNQVFALAATPAKYDCGTCHTTGWKPYVAGSQEVRKDNLPGFEGTFLEWGVMCEGCHGPSKNHTQNPTGVKPPKDGFDGCKTCHARGKGDRIPVKGDKMFLDHREQYDMMKYSKHRQTANMTCVTCHDPHKSTVYDRGGLKSTAKTCQPCHSNRQNITVTIISGGNQRTHTHECVDCHMPYVGNSAVKANNNRGDEASHMWAINTEPVNRWQGMFTADSLNVDISKGTASHTLDFACLGCHTSRDVQWASGYAKDMHTKTITVSAERTAAPSAFVLNQNYPNPFNPSTTITFGLPSAQNVTISIYDELGRLVKVILNGRFDAGMHQTLWDGTDASGAFVNSGTYFYRLEADEFRQTRKMLMMK